MMLTKEQHEQLSKVAQDMVEKLEDEIRDKVMDLGFVEITDNDDRNMQNLVSVALSLRTKIIARLR